MRPYLIKQHTIMIMQRTSKSPNMATKTAYNVVSKNGKEMQ